MLIVNVTERTKIGGVREQATEENRNEKLHSLHDPYINEIKECIGETCSTNGENKSVYEV